MIKIRNHTIPSIVTSTAMGHYGDRIFDFPPLITDRLPAYRRLRRAIKSHQVTSLTKLSTFGPYAGNYRKYRPWTWFKYIRRIGRDGLLNAYKLTNDGVRANAPRIAAAIRGGFDVIPNYYPQFDHGQQQGIKEAMLAIDAYAGSLGSLFWAIEVNGSCPNAENIKQNQDNLLALVRAIRKTCHDLCIIVKISIVHSYEFAKELVKAGADIIHAINTIPHKLVYPKGPPSPLEAVGGGGVSGGPAYKQSYEYNYGLRLALPKPTPIIMGCGVTSVFTARSFFQIDADVVSLCTVCRRDPEEAIKIIEEYANAA